MKNYLALVFLFLACFAFAQQPQVTEPNPQPLWGTNGKWTNGVAPGYYPTCSPASCASTLTLSIGPGTCFDLVGTRHAFAGGSLTMSASSTNYVYLTASSCTLSQSTTGYPTNSFMPIATVTATTTITAIVDDRTWFGGSGGGGLTIKECIVTTGDPAAASPLLTSSNNSPAQCGNDFGADITITAVACWADAGTPQITPILTGGSSTSILTGPLTCPAAAWGAGTVNGTPTVHAFGSNGATCSSTPCTLDSNISTAGAATRYLVVKYTGTTTGGSAAAIAMGTCANHQPCYNNAGALGGIPPGVAGTVMNSQGASSTPIFSGCLLSNGVISKSANYTFDTSESDRGSLITFNGSSLTATLPNPPTDSSWCVQVMNLNPSSLTISRNSLAINTGSSNLTLQQFQSATIWTDGSNYFSTLPFSGGTTTSSSQTYGGGTPPASTPVVGTNSSSQFIASTSHLIAEPLTCDDTSGSGTAQSCSTSPTFTPAAGDCIIYSTTTANTGALTLNVNSSGAAAVQKFLSTALASGDVPANRPQPTCYDGSHWQLMTIGNASGSGGCGGAGNPGLCLLEEHTISSSTASMPFTTCISSSYDDYQIEFLNFLPATSGSHLAVQMSTNGGSTYDTGSNYQWQVVGAFTGSTGSSFPGGSNSDTSALVGEQVSSSSTYGTSGTVHLYNPLGTSLKKIYSTLYSGENSNHIGNFEFAVGGGSYLSTSAVNAFRLLWTSGNIASGIARCYGVSK